VTHIHYTASSCYRQRAWYQVWSIHCFQALTTAFAASATFVDLAFENPFTAFPAPVSTRTSCVTLTCVNCCRVANIAVGSTCPAQHKKADDVHDIRMHVICQNIKCMQCICRIAWCKTHDNKFDMGAWCQHMHGDHMLTSQP